MNEQTLKIDPTAQAKAQQAEGIRTPEEGHALIREYARVLGIVGDDYQALSHRLIDIISRCEKAAEQFPASDRQGEKAQTILRDIARDLAKVAGYDAVDLVQSAASVVNLVGRLAVENVHLGMQIRQVREEQNAIMSALAGLQNRIIQNEQRPKEPGESVNHSADEISMGGIEAQLEAEAIEAASQATGSAVEPAQSENIAAGRA